MLGVSVDEVEQHGSRATTEVRLDRLLFLRNVPAGLDVSVIGHWVMVLKKTAEPVNPPITVRVEAGTPFFRVCDGRHRVIASYIAGRDAIAAHIEEVP